MPSIPAPNPSNSNNGTGNDQARPQSGGLHTPHDTPSQAASADHAELNAQLNEAGVRSAQANWLDGLNNLLYAPDTGYLNQEGAAAVGGYAAVQQAIGKLGQQAQDSLADDHQRAIFTDATAPIINAAQARIQQHAQAQGRVYDADASRARALSARDLAVNAWNPAPGADNSNYRQGAAILHNELENQFRHTWGDPASAGNHTLWNHFLQHGPNGDDGIASLSTGIVNRLLANDQPGGAQAFLNQTRHTLPAPTRDKLQQFITAGLDQHAGMSAALQAQAASSDPAAQQRKLDTLRADGQIGDQAHAIATHKIQADQAAKAAVQQQNDIRTLQKVWALKNASPNAALTDLGSADYAYLKSRGLDANALAILQSHPATDDPGLFNQLHSMASQDPVRFGKANLLAESGKLSRAHMQTLLSLQDAVNKQDQRSLAENTAAYNAISAVLGGTRTKTASFGGQAAGQGATMIETDDQMQTLEAGLRDHVLAWQGANPDKALDSAALQRAGSEYVAGQVLGGDDDAKPQTYVMQKGDSLWGISQKKGIPLEDIQAANPQITDPTKIPVGAVINLPPASTSSMNDQASNSPGASSDSSSFEPDDMLPYNRPPDTVWGVNGFQNIPIARLHDPLTGLAHRPYAIGEKFTHGVVTAGNSYPFDRVMVAQAPGDEKEVNLKQLCREANLDCGLIKMLNGIPLDQTTIPNGAKLLLPNYTEDSALPPGAKLRKRVDLTHAYSEYLAAMKEVRKNPQMMQYMEQDNTGDPFRAIAYVRGSPVPSNDWSVLNWLRVAENGRNHSTENPERIQTVGNYLALARDDHRDVVIIRDNKKIVDNNLPAAERFAIMKEGYWDIVPGAQPAAVGFHRVLKALPFYHGGSTDENFVDKWGLEGDRLRQLDKKRKKAGQ